VLQVEHQIAENIDEVFRHYQYYCGLDYEGIIVRHFANNYVRQRSTGMMKFKPKKSDCYQIIGYKQEQDKNNELKNSLGALICKTQNDDVFSVGSGLTEAQRNLLWKNPDELIGKWCNIQYQHSSGLVPRFPVFVSIEEREVVENYNPLLRKN
jgi:ATP-dependent DNA ligase